MMTLTPWLASLFQRLLQNAIVILGLSFLCFCLLSWMPGDPVDLLVTSNPNITAADVSRLRELYGLDQPISHRYLNWTSTLLSGDLGYSRTYRVPVAELLGPRLANTFLLSLLSLITALAIAIPMGSYSALKPGGRLDMIANFFSFAGISVPSFWLGLMLIIFCSIHLKILPAGGTLTVGSEEFGFWQQLGDRLKYLALPVTSLSLQQLGKYFRFVRSGMIESLGQDYIRTARAKGLSASTILWKHAFRNTLIPMITMIALSLSTLFSGALLTETVFAYQGVGKLAYDSIMANDYNVAMISVLISITMVLIMNFCADLLYGIVDPRISKHQKVPT